MCASEAKKNRRVSKNICEVAIWCRAKAQHPTSSYCHKRTFSQQAQTLWAAALWLHSTSYFRRERSIPKSQDYLPANFNLSEKKETAVTKREGEKRLASTI